MHLTTSLRNRAAAAAIALLLAACGGGSGSGVTAPATTARQPVPAPVSAAMSTGLYFVAGDTGGPGIVDGKGDVARFNYPGSMAFDPAGNLLVTDFNFGVGLLRRVTPDGVVTTLPPVTGYPITYAGFGRNVYTASSAAGFANLFDKAGNRYVSTGDTITKVAPDGSSTLLAGAAGQSGTPVDGTGADARFGRTGKLAMDAVGNLYVLDQVPGACPPCISNGGLIRKVTPTGVVTTLAGAFGNADLADGIGSAAHFNTPLGIVADQAANIFVSDSGKIRKITPAGAVTTMALTRNGTAATVYPGDLAIDAAGYLYAIDATSNALIKVATDGAVSDFAVSPGAGSIVLDSAGNVFVADVGNYLVRKITPSGVATTLAGKAGGRVGFIDGKGDVARFSLPQAVAADAGGNLYLADRDNSAVRKVAPDGTVTTLGTATGVPGYADGPLAVAKFAYPTAVAVDASGSLYVGDYFGQLIRKVSTAGEVSTLAGSTSVSTDVDGIGSKAGFAAIRGLVADAAGNLYVSTNGNTIRKVAPDGTVTTIAGSSTSGSADGTGAAARFNSPAGMALDNAGNLYVADAGSTTIRKITVDGVVTTVAGLPRDPSANWPTAIADGTGTTARFLTLSGMAIGADGNLYVADSGTIRKVTPAGAVTTLAGNPPFTGIQTGALPGTLVTPNGITYLGANVFGVISGNSVLKLAVP